jgi:hypothetical protein
MAGQPHRLSHVVGHQQRAHALLTLHPLEAPVDALAGDGVDGGERLVEQQQARLEHERAAQAQALLLPAGKRVRVAVGDLRRQLHLIEQLAKAGVTRARGQPDRRATQLDVLPIGEVGEQAGALHRVADTAAKPDQLACRNRLAEDTHLPRIGSHQQRVDQLQQGRLAAAAGADHGGGHAGGQASDPIEHHLVGPEAFVDADELDAPGGVFGRLRRPGSNAVLRRQAIAVRQQRSQRLLQPPELRAKLFDALAESRHCEPGRRFCRELVAHERAPVGTLIFAQQLREAARLQSLRQHVQPLVGEVEVLPAPSVRARCSASQRERSASPMNPAYRAASASTGGSPGRGCRRA